MSLEARRVTKRSNKEHLMKLLLLPEPKSISFAPGAFRPARPVRLFVDHGMERPVFQAALKLGRMLNDELHVPASPDCLGDHPAESGHIHLLTETRGREESYRLAITRDSIRISGRGPRGLFYGIQTLAQIFRDQGPRPPCLVIEDTPDYAHRGYYLDVSRGKVPTLSTLQRFAERLASLKINQLQLYVEHAFEFKFDPDISAGSSPLTPGEIIELDAFCRDRYIDLVPSLACFGHMGRVLSLPRYRKLAEVEWPAKDWDSSTWRQRMKGCTIDSRDKRARKLLSDMMDDFLPPFSSRFFNVCGDETYDLGKGKNAAFAAKHGLAPLYIEHIRFLREQARKHGKQIMFWGDVMLQHPESIREIPSDCIALDWGYSPETRFKKTGTFIDAGLASYVCPSVRGYKVVFNDVEEARGNIAGYARSGIEQGAAGLLNTDWGDLGHFNLHACSLHGMGLGAALSWNAGGDGKEGFDKAFSFQFFKDRSGTTGRVFAEAGSTEIAHWPKMIEPEIDAKVDLEALKKCKAAKDNASRWAGHFRRLKPSHLVGQNDLDQLALACDAIGLTAEKTLLDGARSARGKRMPAAVGKRLRTWGRDMDRFIRDYSEVWLAANKPHRLEEIRKRFNAVIRRAKA